MSDAETEARMGHAKAPGRMTRTERCCLLVFAIPVLLFLGLVFLVLMKPSPYQKDFDSEAWRNGAKYGFHEEVPPRQAMVDDLLEGDWLAPGTSKQRVFEVLGAPDQSRPEGDGIRPGVVYIFGPGPSDDMQSRWFFFLGAGRGFAIDNEWLIIEFDDQDRVIIAERYTD